MGLSQDVVVVGAGMAGLACAARLARAGAKVTVLERTERVGGRAASDLEHEALLNQGPHALYRGGPAERELRTLGVTWTGRTPIARGMFCEVDGVAYPLPTSTFGLLGATFLGFGAKVELAKLASAALASNASRAETSNTSVDAWLASTFRHDRARMLARALIRVASYTNELGALSASAGLSQFAKASRRGVAYLDGGWQSLVDGLYQIVRDAGVDVRTHAGARGVTRHDGRLAIGCTDGTSLTADAVVLAVPPRSARAMLESEALSNVVAQLVPARAACLDVVVSQPAAPEHTFTLGIDRPLYLSLHSASARLAPAGIGVYHVAKYLTQEDTTRDPDLDRAELEALFERACPGARDRTLAKRFLPRMTVMHDLRVAPRGGALADVRVADVPGVFVAGDWAAREGMLLDATLTSARDASDAVLDHLAQARRGAA